MAVSDFTTLDFSQTLEANLVAQLVKNSTGKLGATLTEADLIFSTTETIGYDQANTRTLAGFVDPAKFTKADFWIYYRRYDLRKALATVTLDYIASATNATDYLAAINSALGISLTADEVIGSPIVEGKPILFGVKEGNQYYCYSGKLNVKAPSSATPDVALSDLLQTQVLPGFAVP